MFEKIKERVDDEMFNIKDYFLSDNILKTHSQSGLIEEKLNKINKHFNPYYVEE